MWMGVGLAVLLLVAAPALAARKEAGAAGEAKAKPAKAEKAPKAKPEKSVITGQYKEMCDWCSLTAGQQAQLEAAIKARNEKAKAWEEANAQALKDIQAKMAEAKTANNKDAMKAAQDQMKPLSEARKKVQDEGEAAILAVLTADQKDQWAGHGLYQGAVSRMKKANLTEEQTKRIREMAMASGKQIAAAQDTKAKGAAQRKFMEDIEQTVLTAEQREALKAPPKEKPEKPAKEPKAKPEKAAKGAAEAKAPDKGSPAGF
jgi:hypothetical protein